MVEPPHGRMRRAADRARRRHRQGRGESAARTVAALVVLPLAAVGLLSAQYAEAAEKGPRSSSMQGNPVRLSEEELAAALSAAS